jgi:uncharacterized OB-fold protein
VTRPIPVPDQLSAPFWEGVRLGELRLQKCLSCGHFYLPPVPFCTRCSSCDLRFEAVSGRGRVYSFSITKSGARQDVFARMTPYIVGFVELDEQPGLFMYTNFPGSTEDDIEIGQPVIVDFEKIDDVNAIPQFRVVSETSRPKHNGPR